MKGMKKCLCMNSSVLVFMQSKTKKNINGPKKMSVCPHELSCGGIKYTADVVEYPKQLPGLL